MFRLDVNEAQFFVSGVEAAWYAFQTACTLADAVGNCTINLWACDDGTPMELVSTWNS